MIKPKFKLNSAWILFGEETTIEVIIAPKNIRIGKSNGFFSQVIFLLIKSWIVKINKRINPTKASKYILLVAEYS